MKIDTGSIEFRRAARRFVGQPAHSNIPVDVVDGREPPAIAGEGWRYETRTGIRIRHPSAYRKAGFSSMVYVRSTLRVRVGRRWNPGWIC